MKLITAALLTLISSAAVAQGLIPQNTVVAGPTSGGQGFPRPRAVVATDITLPSGQILVGQAGGAANAKALSGDCAIAAAGSITCTKTNGATLTTLSTTTPGTSVATALTVAVGSAGAVIVNGGVLGTPSSGVGSNLTALNASSITLGILATAQGGFDPTAWTAFTPTVTCGTATFTTTSARRKTIGKTTFIEIDFTIATLGTCSALNATSFTLPNTPQSSGALAGQEIALTGAGASCRVTASSATSFCLRADLANYLVNQRYVFSGVYENQ